MPLIQLHSFTNLSPPLISLALLSSFPPGEAKNSEDFDNYHSTSHSVAWGFGRLRRSGRQVGDPYRAFPKFHDSHKNKRMML